MLLLKFYFLKAFPQPEELDFYFLLTTQGAVKHCQTDLPTACLGLSWAEIPSESWIRPSGRVMALAPTTEFKCRDY